MPIRSPYRLAIFDFDGTLADTFAAFTHLVSFLADELGFERIEEHELEELRRKNPVAVMKRLGIPAWRLPFIVNRMRALLASEAYGIKLFAGAGDCLQTLNDRGVRLSIVSSNAEPTIRRVLGPDLAGLVDTYACNASLWGKPAKLRKVLRWTGIEGAHAIYIGDEIRDAQAARTANIAFGAVSWGYTPLDALLPHEPREVFTDFHDLASKVKP